MIQQPTMNDVYYSHGSAHEHQPPNQSAVFRTGVVSFFKSLHPGFISGSSNGQVAYPDFCADSAGSQGHCLIQQTRLAARVISGFTGLPAEVVSFVGDLANLYDAAHWVNSKYTELVADNDHEGKYDTRKKQRPGPTCRRPARLPAVAIALGTASGLGTVSGQKQWVDVDDTATLNKIGRDPAYPLDGRYRQVADVDASGMTSPIGDSSHPFVGEYDGQCKLIRNLNHCFVAKLDGNGLLYNQIFSNANIVSDRPAGVVACQISGQTALLNNVVKESNVTTTKENAPAGFATAIAGGDTVISGFKLLGPATVRTLREKSHAGLVVGTAQGTVSNSTLINGKAITEDVSACAGGGAGYALAGAVIDKTMLVQCELVANGTWSEIGGGAGYINSGATVSDTLLMETNLKTFGHGGNAGAGGGRVYGDVINTTMVDGEISTHNNVAHAGVGAGDVFSSGQVSQTTGRNVTVKTSGSYAHPGVGAGVARGTVSQTLCYNSNIVTTNTGGTAAIGAGYVLGGEVDEIVAIKCNVTTSGEYANAGLGSGFSTTTGKTRRLTAVYSKAEATGEGSGVCIGEGNDSFNCSTTVGGHKSLPCCDNNANSSCLPVPNELCRYADQRVLTTQCEPLPSSFVHFGEGEGLICQPVSEHTVRTLRASLNVAGAPTTADLNNVTAPVTPVVLSGSAAGGLSVGSWVGISFGAFGVASLLGIGYLFCRHYCNRDPGQQRAAPDSHDDL